jgi:hypothetical protein
MSLSPNSVRFKTRFGENDLDRRTRVAWGRRVSGAEGANTGRGSPVRRNADKVWAGACGRAGYRDGCVADQCPGRVDGAGL